MILLQYITIHSDHSVKAIMADSQCAKYKYDEHINMTNK